MAYTNNTAVISASNGAHWIRLDTEIVNNTATKFDLKIRIRYQVGSGGSVNITKNYTDSDGTSRPYVKIGSTTYYYNRVKVGTWSGADTKTIDTVTISDISKSQNPQTFSCTWREYIINTTTVASKTTTFSLTVPAATYTISYNGNGYSNKSATATKTHGVALPIRSYFADVNSYLIQYNKNGGSSTPADQQSKLEQYAWCSDAKGNSSTGGSGTLRYEGYEIIGNKNQTVYAIWRQKPITLAGAISRTGNKSTATYTITYNNNTGSGTIAQGSLTRNTPYAFDKWAQGSTSGTKYSASSSFTPSYKLGENHSEDTITMYATWKNGTTTGSTTLSNGSGFSKSNTTASGFKVTINANQGTSSISSLTALNTISYTLNSWNTKADGTGTKYEKSGTYNKDSNVTLYAQWSSTVSKGSVNLPNATQCTRQGHTLLGWSTSSSATSASYNPGASYTPTGNVTLYAVWKINTYNLKYYTNSTNSDTLVSNMPDNVSGINYGTSYTISSTLPLKFPYQFEDWYCVEDSTYYDPSTSIVINSDKTLYPYWRNPVELISKTTNNILYIYNGGGEGYYKFTPSETATYVVYSTTHGTDSKDVKSYLLNSSATQLIYNDDHGKSLNNQIGNWDFLISYDLTAGQTYYYKTQFLSSEYTGNISVNCGPTYNIQYIDELELATMPSNGTKYYGLYCDLTSAIPSRGDNWEFTGWKINDINYTSGAFFADDDAGVYNSILSEYIIEAKSQWQKYISLNYNTNGGSNIPSSASTYIYNTTTSHTFTISSTIPIKTHYKFLGWYLEDGDYNGITNFQPGDSITLSNSATLRAIWLNYGTSKVQHNSSFYNAIPYIYVNGAWKECMPFIYSNNQWYHPLSENTDSYLTYNIINNSASNNYGFKLNNNGFYESQNKNIDNSYALCTINLIINNSCKIYLDCINYGESNFDYGLISNLNSSLSASNTADTDYKKTFKGEQSAYVQTVSYGTLSPGFYTIMIKFRKDGSVNSNNDSLQFRLRYE